MSEIVSQLRALKLHGMADSYAELLSQGRNASVDMSEWLIKHLIDAETTDRAIRRYSRKWCTGKFSIMS